ncbi:MAG: hypothetical protein A3E31_15510 [Candidatus Rokubacteria bacterium RIFCSPHIGHO2_12_FULL_73_22]|nr:MAG: hypothetical protein A3D33_04475 [Candidatus Rokubacteria bacterium RIFCSPHIGHO2_02_FULL_73_26]OGK99600.1 MAG: hypothetical protein A3E31_15510 [Candidatus Rokubacteria bacterium RIFCSPHIGHO2_12_FULL_73_22]OGL10367.1 MAG: hypothetical protein A3I14_09735 [Candidatus Rokubacteria bacterium RIFCSPLOWO2_02_FULL_73_56]OGL21700.1 MAG: hypothetical protein A3G44_16360 [Candidatus Rokubacteria bacterium RIFCSPLOWO2_12_FULL_73_47]
MRARITLASALVLALSACAAQVTDQRSTQGPTAEEVWTASVILAAGRPPTFDEKRHWDLALDEKISGYLRRHPAAANALEVSTFRFLRQVTVGMTKEQVLILLGPPAAATTDGAELARLARGHRLAVTASGAGEAWVYPQGWRLYFADTTVVDITQYLERK